MFLSRRYPSEIEQEIADIETIVSKEEERQEILNEFSNPVKKSRPKVQQQKDNSQLSLFYPPKIKNPQPEQDFA